MTGGVKYFTTIIFNKAKIKFFVDFCKNNIFPKSKDILKNNPCIFFGENADPYLPELNDNCIPKKLIAY